MKINILNFKYYKMKINILNFKYYKINIIKLI